MSFVILLPSSVKIVFVIGSYIYRPFIFINKNILSYELSNKIDNYIKKQTILLDTIYDTDVTYIFGLDNPNKIETIKEYTKGIEPILIGEEIIQKVVE